MKKILFFILPIIILAGGVYIFKNYFSKDNVLGTQTETTASPTPTSPNQISIDYQDKSLNINWFEADPSKVSLIPNFSAKLASSDVKTKYQCDKLTNAGFYTEDQKPIGLFVNDNGSLGNWHKNSLFNGVLSINFQETPRITETEPRDILRVALQTGPILKENDAFQNLTLQNDKFSRRTIAFTTGENRLYFASIYSPNMNFSGPALADLPKVLGDFEKKTGVQIADAINLDGGSASAYFDSNVSLPEITTVGSFFCIQN